MDIKQLDIVLCVCEFYFSDIKKSKNKPVLIFKDNLPYDDFIAIPISSQIDKLHLDDLSIGSLPKISKTMVKKTFVISKKVVLKKYATISSDAYQKYHKIFCSYFGC